MKFETLSTYILPKVLEMKEVDPFSAMLLGRLLVFSSKKQNAVYYSLRRGASEFHVSKNTVQRAIKALNDADLLSFTKHTSVKDGKLITENLYQINFEHPAIRDSAIPRSGNAETGNAGFAIPRSEHEVSQDLGTQDLGLKNTDSNKKTDVNTNTAQQAAPRAPFPPKNADQVLECMQSQVTKHPEWHADTLNLEDQAAKLFEYYEDNGWRAATGNPLRSLRNAISSWLPRAVKEQITAIAPVTRRRDQTEELREAGTIFPMEPANSTESEEPDEPEEVSLVADGSKK